MNVRLTHHFTFELNQQKMNSWVKNIGIEWILIDYNEGFLGLARREADEDEIICKEKEVAVYVFNHLWSNYCILRNVGLVIMLNNPTSFTSFHPVVAIKLFALYSSIHRDSTLIFMQLRNDCNI